MLTAQPGAALEAESDDALMRRVAARDGEAFRVLVGRCGEPPYRVAWRMLGDATEAQDVAQEALLRLWQNAERWRGDGPGLSAWLIRVATNLCLDRLRSRARLGPAEKAETIRKFRRERRERLRRRVQQP